jgi:hypothetical protein
LARSIVNGCGRASIDTTSFVGFIAMVVSAAGARVRLGAKVSRIAAIDVDHRMSGGGLPAARNRLLGRLCEQADRWYRALTVTLAAVGMSG